MLCCSRLCAKLSLFTVNTSHRKYIHKSPTLNSVASEHKLKYCDSVWLGLHSESKQPLLRLYTREHAPT